MKASPRKAINRIVRLLTRSLWQWQYDSVPQIYCDTLWRGPWTRVVAAAKRQSILVRTHDLNVDCRTQPISRAASELTGRHSARRSNRIAAAAGGPRRHGRLVWRLVTRLRGLSWLPIGYSF